MLCQVLDGNRADDTTHIETWNILRALVGKADFIYVADCKLASKENLAHIHNNGGFFVTIMPRNRGENQVFKKRLQQDGLIWKALELPGRSNNPEEKILFEGVEAEAKSSDGYRILWIRSSQKQRLDAAARQSAIQKALAQIKSLAPRVGTRNLKTRDQIQARIEKILLQSDAAKWVEVEILEKHTTSHKHQGRGRPAKDAVPLELVHTEYTVVARPLESAIEADKRADGLFPLITNVPDKSIQEVLSIYKYQPKLEKRHQQLKSVLTVAPMHLKTVERIEALLFLEFIALLVHALLEREVRRAMERHGCVSLPLYHERRPSEHPTAAQILGAFEQLRVHRLRDNGIEVQVFRDALNPIHRTLLKLLGLSPSIFGQN